MIVCLCRGVSDRKVRLAVLAGAASLSAVARACDAGRGCGACHEEIERLVDEGNQGEAAAIGICAAACAPAILAASTTRGTP
jgi:bacterioferritin-associated ferredoxin